MTSTILPRSELAGLHAVVTGSGRPFVLLHGVGLRAEAWRAQIEALSADYQVIAPDMPGHGQSPAPSAPIPLATYVSAYEPLLATLSEPAILVGHSMGAMIALELAHRMPEKVKGLAALNAIFERTPEAAQAVQNRAAQLDGAALPDPKPTLIRWFGAAHSPERMACETWLREIDPKGYQSAYRAFAHADGPSREGLTGMPCSALFITGALEPNSTPDMSRAMAALAPKGTAQIIKGAAHMMPMTHADEVNAALTTFAQEV